MKFWNVLRWLSGAVFAVVLAWALWQSATDAPAGASPPPRLAPSFFR